MSAPHTQPTHQLFTSDSQLDYRCAASAFVLRGLGHGDYVRVLLQELAEGFAEDAHAAAVNDADARESGEEGAVDELFDLGGGFVDVAANDVDF